jgi:large subunit ribosomal protein L23
MDPYQVILRPHISEKAHEKMDELDTYTFRVHADATKTDIRNAVVTIWGVKIKSIRTLNNPAKQKRFGRYKGYRPAWKKAIVRLAEGQAIETLR